MLGPVYYALLKVTGERSLPKRGQSGAKEQPRNIPAIPGVQSLVAQDLHGHVHTLSAGSWSTDIDDLDRGHTQEAPKE